MWSICDYIWNRKIFIGLFNRAHVVSRYRQPIKMTKNEMKVMKDKLLVFYIMKHLSTHKYVHIILRTFVLHHLTACGYQFLGDDTDVKAYILQFFPRLGLCIEIKYYVDHIFMDVPWITTQKYLFNKNGKFFHLATQIKQDLLGFLNIWNFKYCSLEDISLFFIVTDNFISHHFLFLIFTHIQWSYDQYPKFFYFPILIHSTLMTTQMDLVTITFPVS